MIGVFDSGFGGLTVLKSLQEKLPDYSYLYFGDSGRAPYGDKNSQDIITYSRQATRFLFAQGAKIVIFACVTASSIALRTLQAELAANPQNNRHRVLGVLRPIAEAVVAEENNKRVGVIGTCATIASQAFNREINELAPSVSVFGQACPLLVPLIEGNRIHNPETRQITYEYLRPLFNLNIDCLVLGCTHYPLLRDLIVSLAPAGLRIPFVGDIVATSLAAYLRRHPELEPEKRGRRIFYSSDTTHKFQEWGSKYLGSEIEAVNYINLADNDRS